MVDNTWAYENETKVLGILNSYAIPNLRKKFPSMKWQKGVTITNVESSLSKPTFPTIYVHELPGTEQGRTLDGQNINGVLTTFEVQTFTNTSQYDAKIMLAIVADVFKAMRFEATPMPEFKSDETVYRSVARFRRILGANDRLMDK